MEFFSKNLLHFCLACGCLACSLVTLTGCLSDKHSTGIYPQKIYESVNAKYPTDKNTLIFIEAPEGYIAPRQAIWEVEKDVDAGDVTAIISSLALKTSTVIIAGEDESLTSTTLARALTIGKDKVSGGKAIVVGSKESQKHLTALASASNVTLEFIDSPN
jgi:hypothetical protein